MISIMVAPVRLWLKVSSCQQCVFFPLGWLINACFPMLFNSKFMQHCCTSFLVLITIHSCRPLAKQIPFKPSRIKSSCLLIFHQSSSTMLQCTEKERNPIVQSINYHRSKIHIKITTESLVVKDSERNDLQQIVS